MRQTVFASRHHSSYDWNYFYASLLNYCIYFGVFSVRNNHVKICTGMYLYVVHQISLKLESSSAAVTTATAIEISGMSNYGIQI